MCGIAGVITRGRIGPEQVACVARMNDLLAHRGPDGEGTFQAPHVALAMRRLSIIDLAGGWQPIYNEDRSLALVCNGEVYNFVELRRDLEARGHRFATRSDCETILHLYEEHGERCVDHLRGMYAFALWDGPRRRLFLARDRMGEKPLYLVERDGSLVFASELKALVGAGVVPFELDPAAVHLYYHYAYVPEPQAAVAGVRKLPAAHTLSVDVDPWRVRESCYWRMHEAEPIEGEPAAVIRRELQSISELIIRSDVPVGVALSAGLDSSVIATLAARNYPGTMQAICVGYPGGPRQDERHEARALAEHLGMPFHEVELATDEMIAMLPQIAFERDDPIGDLAGASLYAVMQRARALGVPVMLSGQGGDELFWGYAWTRQAVAASARKAGLLNGSSHLRDYLRVTRPPRSYVGSVRWLRGGAGLRSGWRQYRRDRRGPAERLVFYDLTAGFDHAHAHLGGAYTADFAERVHAVDPCALFTIDHPWPELDVTVTRLICETYLLENGLAQSDRLSMAHSVEMRLPLVDYRLVERVIGLRKAHPDVQLAPKRWLRDAVKDIVPEFVLARRKRGFSPPWRPWVRALSAAFGHFLETGYLVEHGVLSPGGAARLARQLAPGRLGVPDHLAVQSLVLELWCRGMRERAGAAATGAAVVRSA